MSCDPVLGRRCRCLRRHWVVLRVPYCRLPLISCNTSRYNEDVTLSHCLMDPFSGTASAIAILQLSGAIIATCYDYQARIRSAAKDAKQIINELNSLRTVIESLLMVLDEERDARAPVSVLEKLAQKDGSLEGCQNHLEELTRKLEPREGWRHVKAVLLWPLKESDVKKVLGNIQDTKSTIHLALSLDHRYTTSS
jgi:hypothetical protein